MVQRVTQDGIVILSANDGPVRVTQDGIVVALGKDGPIRTTMQGLAVSLGRDGPIRVTMNGLLVMQSIHRMAEMEFLDAGPTFYDPELEISYDFPPVPEFNPYRPTIPEEYHDISPVFYDFEKEHREITRQQHNLAQAGDSTFPWEMLAQLQTTPDFTLGSTGRFYHETYGLIQARYVQFKGMVEFANPATPCGLMNIHPSLQWVVTNDLTRSKANLVVGIKAAGAHAEDDQYGWVIVNGTNIASSQLADATVTRGDPLSWSATGLLSPTGLGRVVCRSLRTILVGIIPPGTLKIELESKSWAEIQLLFGPLQTQIDSLDDRLTLVETNLGTVEGLGTQLTLLSNRLNAEVNARTQADNALRALITGGTYLLTATFNSFQNSNNIRINALDVRLTAAAATAQARADAAYLLASGIVVPDLTGLSTEIAELRYRIGILEALPYGILPLVDGSVPPNLMYLDDGSLIWVEVF